MIGVPDLAFIDNAGTVLGGLFGCQIGPLKEGYTAMDTPKPLNVEFGAEFKPAIAICFGDSQPFRFQPVFETLHQLTQLVDGIIATFDAHIT